MKLRTRLFVTSLAVATPLALVVFFLNDRMRTGDMEQTLRRYLETPGVQADLARCESPGRPGMGRPGLPGPPDGGPPRDGPPPNRPGPPPLQRDGGPFEVFSYGRDFSPSDPRGPAMPEALRGPLGRGETALATFGALDGRGVAVGASVGGPDAPCPYAVARMGPRRGALHDQLMALALVFVSVLGAAWLAGGPVISRMRRLADRVRQSASANYEVPVTLDGSTRDELADLARAFNDAGATVRRNLLDLQARRESLQRFVADTTHDVALPLTVLQGHLAELEHGAPADGPLLAHVRGAMQEAHYMSSLLRNLATAARLDEPAAASRHSVDLSALVERVASRHAANARARDVTIEHAVPETPVAILTDLTLLEQVVSNLADNAVQYNRAGGHVAIVLDRRGPDRFVIMVKDDGPGIAEADRASVRSRRVRGNEARSRRPDGQGLGLAIAAEACERLGFTLSLSSPVDGGLEAEIAGAV